MADEDDRWLPPAPEKPEGPSNEELPGSFSDATTSPSPEQPGSQWGAPAAPPLPAGGSGAEPGNGKAVAALVLGIVGLPIVCPLFIPSILAVIFGHLSRGEYKRWGGHASGKGMATAGVILGWVSIGLQVIGWIVLIVLLSTDNLGQDRDGDDIPDWLDTEPDNPDVYLIAPLLGTVARAAIAIAF